MNNKRLVYLVDRAVDSCCESPEDILEGLNEGMAQVSNRVLIPELIGKRTLVINDAITARYLPDDFQRELFSCKEVGGRGIDIFNSHSQMAAEFGTMGGKSSRIEGVAVQGRELLFHPIPAIEVNIEIKYYRKPDQIFNDEQEVPLPLHFRKALVHYAASSIYADIENGIEGPKPNTDFHNGKFEEFMFLLGNYYKEGVSRKPIAIVKGEFL